MTVLVADMHAYVQRPISIARLATMLEEFTTEEQRCLCSLWAKGLDAKDIHKEMFPVFGWKCLSCKAVHTWVEKFCQGR
jgi:hypothetical protein